jgi:hypothetical protein
MATRYQHTQRGWVIIAATALVTVLAVPPMVDAELPLGWIPLSAILVVLLAGFGTMTVTADEGSVEATITLEKRLPRIRLRTNGLALAGTLRGHFRLDELGDGQLFIEAGTSPYVLVRTHNDYVLINFAEPERTRKLYAQVSGSGRSAPP